MLTQLESERLLDKDDRKTKINVILMGNLVSWNDLS